MEEEDGVKCSSVTSGKNKFSHIFSKVLLHGGTGIWIDPIDGNGNAESDEGKKAKDPFKNTQDELQDSAFEEAFLAQVFARITAIKAAYAQLQFAQFPYDPDGIESADRAIVAELKNLFDLKQSYSKKELNDPDTDLEITMLLSEYLEVKSLQKLFEVMIRKLDSELKLKDSEITFMKEKLAETNRENKLIEKKLYSSGPVAVPDGVRLPDLNQNHFISYLRHSVKSIRSFVRLLISEMESAGWNLDKAACAIEPGVSFVTPEHRFYAFESFICKEMFNGFNGPNFQTGPRPEPEKYLDQFAKLKSVRPMDYLTQEPRSPFTMFCCARYLNLVHPKMEASFFGNTSSRDLLSSGNGFPDTAFFVAFGDMAKRLWLLHCLGQAFDPPVTIFVVGKGSRFSELYMESMNDDVVLMMETEPRVAFPVVPGFRIGKTVIQCQVYLR